MKSKLFILFAVVLGTYSQATVSGGIVSITVENNSRFPYLLSVVHTAFRQKSGTKLYKHHRGHRGILRKCRNILIF